MGLHHRQPGAFRAGRIGAIRTRTILLAVLENRQAVNHRK